MGFLRVTAMLEQRMGTEMGSIAHLMIKITFSDNINVIYAVGYKVKSCSVECFEVKCSSCIHRA